MYLSFKYEALELLCVVGTAKTTNSTGESTDARVLRGLSLFCAVGTWRCLDFGVGYVPRFFV
jgi:hypothetical protein